MHLFISTLPPARCGVAAYAAEHLEVLRDAGAIIQTAAPDPDSHADIRIDTTTLAGAWRWLRFCMRGRYDQVHLHYVDVHCFRGRDGGPIGIWVRRLMQALALRRLASRARHSSIILHELPHHGHRSVTYRALRSLAFAGFSESIFHTEPMRADCLRLYPGLRRTTSRIADHTQFMRRKFAGNPTEARRRLGLDSGSRVLLCIGFLQSSKGFDEAAKAFASAGLAENCQLHIVGSLRSTTPEEQQYADSLRTLCQRTPRSFLHECYLSDESFDCWLAAADLVILPYRGIASSGVGARASLYGKKLVIRNLPNLTDQFPDARTFSNCDELADEMGMES